MQISTHICRVFVVVLLTLSVVPAAQAATLSRSERSLLGALNDVRAAHNLRPLKVDVKLLAGARAYSKTLIQQDVFTHGAFAERVTHSGARGPSFGENLAWGTGHYASASNIISMWMNSPGHRENLLRPGWTRIGIGARVGNFLGYPSATVITADFAGS
jgi:uncharacterized protein YkwD